MTTAGLFGTVTAVDGDKVELEVAAASVSGSSVAAIAQVVDPARAIAGRGGNDERRRGVDTENDTPEA